MNEIKSNEVDLRTLIEQPASVRVALSDYELYEVRFEVLAARGAGGVAVLMWVFRSLDNGHTWNMLGLKRNWYRQWWAILKGGLGGSWPPSWSDFREAYIKNGKFSIAYCNPYDPAPSGECCIWEMQYDPAIDRWDLSLLDCS